MYTYVFMTSIRVIPVSAVLSRVPYECLYLQKWVTPPLFGAAPHSLQGVNLGTPGYTIQIIIKIHNIPQIVDRGIG